MIPIKEPKPEVQLVGIDGNAFVVLGACRRALRKAFHDEAYLQQFDDEAKSGDYDKLLQTCMKYLEVS